MTDLSQEPPNRKNPWRKRLLIAGALLLGVILLLVGIAFIVAYTKGSRIIQAYLEAKVKEQTKGLYTLSMKDLDLVLFPGRLRISELSLVPDTNRYWELMKTDTVSSILLTLHVNKIIVRDFDVMRAIREKEIYLKRLQVDAPDIRLDEYPVPVRIKSEGKREIPLSLKLPEGLHLIDIREVRVNDGRVAYLDHRFDTLRETKIPFLSLEVDSILVDTSKSANLFNAADIRVTLRGLAKTTKNGMNRVSLGEIGISTGKKRAWIRDFHLEPLYAKVEYARKLGYQTDWTEVKAGTITLEGLDIPSLLLNEHFAASRVTLEQVELDDYRDKRNPMRKNFFPPMPHQLLTGLKTQITIDTVLVRDGKITYSEQTGERPGEVSFTGLSLTAAPVTTDSLRMTQGYNLNVNASAKLLGAAPISLHITFPMPAKNGYFSFSGLLTQLDLTLVNPFISAFVPVEIKQGTVSKLVIGPVQANLKNSHGSLTMYYRDLDVKFPPVKDQAWKNIKKGILSFAANTFVAESNPGGNGKLRQGIVYFERDATKSIFNYLWKSIFSGVKSTIGINSKEQKEIRKGIDKKKK